MSTVCVFAGFERTRSEAPSFPPLPAPVEFRYTQTDSFVALLHQLQVSLLVSTYQANKLLVVRTAGNGLSTLVRSFERPSWQQSRRRHHHAQRVGQRRPYLARL